VIEIRQLSRTTPISQGASKIVSLQKPGEGVYGQGQGWSENLLLKRSGIEAEIPDIFREGTGLRTWIVAGVLVGVDAKIADRP
jgi:hypothetical protein